MTKNKNNKKQRKWCKKIMKLWLKTKVKMVWCQCHKCLKCQCHKCLKCQCHKCLKCQCHKCLKCQCHICIVKCLCLNYHFNKINLHKCHLHLYHSKMFLNLLLFQIHFSSIQSAIINYQITLQFNSRWI